MGGGVWVQGGRRVAFRERKEVLVVGEGEGGGRGGVTGADPRRR